MRGRQREEGGGGGGRAIADSRRPPLPLQSKVKAATGEGLRRHLRASLVT